MEAVPRPPAPLREDDARYLSRPRWRNGRLVPASGNQPILLDDPDVAWIVFSGFADVFAVPLREGRPNGIRRHLFRASRGAALFGTSLRGRRVGLLARGGPDTQVLRIARSSLLQSAPDSEAGTQAGPLIDRWVDGLSSAIEREPPPRDFEQIEAGQELELADGNVARTRGGVLWIIAREGGVRFLGRAETAFTGAEIAFPLSPSGWLVADGRARLDALETARVLDDGAPWDELDQFHDLMLTCLEHDEELRVWTDRRRLAEQEEVDRSRLELAYARLASILAPKTARSNPDEDDHPLLAAARIVGQALDIAIARPRTSLEGQPDGDLLAAIASSSGVRTRRVTLRGTWWKHDLGPLLSAREPDRRPVALIPASGGRYTLHDPSTGEVCPVTADIAATLSPAAHAFHRRLPARPLAGRDLLAFGLHGAGRDLATVILAGCAIGVLGMLTPIATGILFDVILPGPQRVLLLQLGAMLVVGALASALFQLVQGIAALRLEGRLDAALQAAVLDRLLDLPTTFFHAYSAGDLGSRAMGISTIRQTLSRVALATALAGISALSSVVVLFAIDLRLALVATTLTLLFLLVVFLASRIQLRHQRALGQIAGQLSGTVLQLIYGIAKLRGAGAESRAFAVWADRFTMQRRLAYRARTMANLVAVASAAFPVVASLAIFGAMAFDAQSRISTGAFLAFSAAFGQLVAAVLSLSTVFGAVLQVVPTYERARPILCALPEVGEVRANPGELHGEIEVNHVSFRYQPDGPLILDDVSIHARPGEFVALVGPSGSGKSTLLRLLLGFESPDSGTILYDGHDLAGLDLRAVRRQIGTVLQSGRLVSGDIFTNVVGSLPLTLDDAWEAVRMAGLEDDIRRMPMGMHTMIGDGGRTLSGGQRQRLLIARAIAARPRLIFFDEATSALDNRTQEIVGNSLQSLAATRVVIAHRLSTIANADRIYVIAGGRVVESGTYPELMRNQGLFAELARRQIA